MLEPEEAREELTKRKDNKLKGNGRKALDCWRCERMLQEKTRDTKTIHRSTVAVGYGTKPTRHCSNSANELLQYGALLTN